MTGAAWGRICGKQDCNRAGGLPRAVLTHARQDSISQTTQPEPTAINCNPEKKRCPTDSFFKYKAGYQEAGGPIPRLLIIREAPAASHLLKFHLKTASGLRTARLLKFCRLPQEADKEVTSRLQIGASGSED